MVYWIHLNTKILQPKTGKRNRIYNNKFIIKLDILIIVVFNNLHRYTIWSNLKKYISSIAMISLSCWLGRFGTYMSTHSTLI